MAEQIPGPFAIGGAAAGSLLPPHNGVRRLPEMPAGSLAFLTATGIVGAVLVGGLFAACFSLLTSTPPARQGPAALISIRAGPSPGPADAVAMAVSPVTERTALASPTALPGPTGATLSPAAATLSVGDIARALARGDAFFHNGDLAMARFFFQLAVDAGDRRAALRLGETFDPAFLTHRRGRSDTKAARYWYQRALDLGAKDAASHRDSLDVETSR
jgi:hypothetical protein